MSSGRRPLAVGGAAERAPTAPAARGRSRAFGLGRRRAVFAVVVGAALAVGLLAASLGGLAGGRNGSSGVARHGAHVRSFAGSSAKYGGLPSWLPKQTVRVDRIVTASVAHPALAIQGDAVSIDLPRGRVLATAVGPEVPEDGRFPVPATSPCTFIVTFAAASGVVPLSAAAFTLVDEFGHVHHARVTAMDGGAPPRQVVPGRTVSLRLHDVQPTGNGALRWTPGGARPIVAWDFDVEID